MVRERVELRVIGAQVEQWLVVRGQQLVHIELGDGGTIAAARTAVARCARGGRVLQWLVTGRALASVETLAGR